MRVPVRQTEHVSTAGAGGGPSRNGDGRPILPATLLPPWEQRRRRKVLHASHPPVSTRGARQGGRGDGAEGLLPPRVRPPRTDSRRPLVPQRRSRDLSQSAGAGGSR